MNFIEHENLNELFFAIFCLSKKLSGKLIIGFSNMFKLSSFGFLCSVFDGNSTNALLLKVSLLRFGKNDKNWANSSPSVRELSASDKLEMVDPWIFVTTPAALRIRIKPPILRSVISELKLVKPRPEQDTKAEPKMYKLNSSKVGNYAIFCIRVSIQNIKKKINSGRPAASNNPAARMALRRQVLRRQLLTFYPITLFNLFTFN